MRPLHFIHFSLQLCTLVSALRIPTEPSLLPPNNDSPPLNSTTPRNFINILDETDSQEVTNRLSRLGTFRPWPPAPFNFRSPTNPQNLLRITSFSPSPQLTYRQLHALLFLTVQGQDILQLLAPDTPLPEQDWVFRATQTRPYDLTREDVELVFFNGEGEEGRRYTAMEMVAALGVMVERVVPRDMVGMRRSVVHYCEGGFRMGRERFRRWAIRRRTPEVRGVEGLGWGVAVV